jgi:hypothetical protein
MHDAVKPGRRGRAAEVARPPGLVLLRPLSATSSTTTTGLVFQLLLDAAGGVRTHDLRIKSPLLYQLSYSGGHHMIA